MPDIAIRIRGQAGRITLTRPGALNALSHQMCRAIDATLKAWAEHPAVKLVVIDAEGDKAFCAGGDIQDLYATGTEGDYSYAHSFWADEYRLNARIAEYPKPFIALMQGYVMGGGVGISCHGSHRIVCESSQIAMPECGIGLVPDVGGSLILSRAPGRAGEYLGLTAARMGPDDAIYAGFADTFVSRAHWADLTRALEETGAPDQIEACARQAPKGALRRLQLKIDTLFGGEDLRAILRAMAHHPSPFTEETQKKLARNSPIAMACTMDMIRQLRRSDATIRDALDLEYRFTARAMEQGDFLEGVRAAIIDKDRAPVWRHRLEDPLLLAVAAMLAPLGPRALRFEKSEEDI